MLLRRAPESVRSEPTISLPDEATPVEPAGPYVDPADRPALAAPRPRRWIAPIVVALAIIGTYVGWRLLQPPPPPVVAVPEVAPKPAPEVAQEPVEKHPLPDALSGAKPDVSLPSLADSDAVLSAAIVSLASNTTLRELLRQTDVARRIVATIDNLPRNKVPWKLLPVTPPSGAFLVAGPAARPTIDPRNSTRYAPYMRIVDAVDPKELATVYGAYYPLLQEQYRALGYPSGNFNDRVIEAIDDLLAAPVLTAPPVVTQPKVLYEFANPDLEARSAGQKMMLRLAPADAEKVKAKLREIRDLLTGGATAEARQQGKQ
jgi:hypothetical protein